ncbi:MAG: hypothetical protein WCR83_07135 [Candidatus Methanomethylophilaceae archaeon]
MTFCKVRLYETVGGRYIDITGQIQGPKIREVENYGATGTLTVINELDSSSRNLLSSSCTRWTSGTGAIKTGMFLYIYKDSISSANQLGIYIITALSVSDDVISLTFGDAIQILRATGADYYRNHYEPGGYVEKGLTTGGWDNSEGKLYIVKQSNVTLRGGSVDDVEWAVNRTLSPEEASAPRLVGFVNAESEVESSDPCAVGKYIEFIIPAGARINWIYSFQWTDSNSGSLTANVNYRMDIYIGSTNVGSQTYSRSYGSSVRTVSFSTPKDNSGKNNTPVNTIKVRFTITGISNNPNFYITAGVAPTDAEYGGNAAAFLWQTSTGRSGTERTLYGQLVHSYYCIASGSEDVDDKTHWLISSIDGVSTIDSSMLYPSHNGRGMITYQSPDSGKSLTDIMSQICSAAGFTKQGISSSLYLSVFRCGGDYYHNYLLTLADISESDGRQHGICAHRSDWSRIIVGYRYKASDTSVATFYYAGDSSPSSGAIPMKMFIPSLSFSGKSYLAVTKGTKDDGTPIMVAMRDSAVSIGSAISIVDGSITDPKDAALTSYSKIMANRSKDWDGKIVLSGIYTQFMLTSGSYVGGVPIRIYDSRYGMSGYQARVKEVQLDFTNQTTTLTINNYSEVYSNLVVDSTKMAYSGGNLAVDATSNDLFIRQYVFVEGGSLSSGTSHTIEIYSGGSWYSVDADVIQVPELGIAVLSGYFAVGVGTNTVQYGVTYIRVDGGTSINIPSAKRPDKRYNQSLIVNVQVSI